MFDEEEVGPVEAGDWPWDSVEESDCRALWAAVVVQACIDARTQSRKKCAEKIKREALAWLQSESEDSDFLAVCDLAGLSPSCVRKELDRHLREGSGPNFHCVRKGKTEAEKERRIQSTNQKGECHEQNQ